MRSPVPDVRIVVVGAGAIGSLLAWALALTGHDVLVVRRGQTGPATPGSFTVERPNGSQHSASITHAGPDALAIAAESASPVDLAVVAVKQYDVPSALAILAGLPGVAVLTVENGIGAEEEASAARPTGRLLAGSITASVARRGDGTIRWLRIGGLGLAGVRGDAESLGREVLIAAAAAGMAVRWFPDAAAMKWSKLVANLVGNATSALLDMDPAAVYANPGLFAIERAQLREALAVARARGWPIVDLPGAPVRLLALATGLPGPLARLALTRTVGGARGGKDPSLRVALGAGGPTEVDWLNGAVARVGQAAGVSVPVNRLLAELVDEASRQPERRDWFRGRPDRLVDAVTLR